MNSLKPMLLTCLKSYDKSQFIKDVTAGIIVAIIALPYLLRLRSLPELVLKPVSLLPL